MQIKKVNNWAILLALIAAVSLTLINCGGKNPTGPTPLNVDLSGILTGSGIPDAADYIPGPGLHPIAVFGAIPTTAIPDEWLAKSVSTLELVAHGIEGRLLIETCTYFPYGTIQRYSRVFKVDLYAAKSAVIVASETFISAPPPECPSSDFFEPGEVKMYLADPVPIQTIVDWLEGFVTGPESHTGE